MGEALVGLRFAAPTSPRPQSQRHHYRLLPTARFTPIWRGRLHTARAAVAGPPEVDEDEAMNIDNLHRFFDLNIGKWDGSFYQFDAHGSVLQWISTRLSVSTYGEDKLISLLQSLYIKQASSAVSIVDEKDSEPEWVEYKIKETNMFSVDKYQQCTDRIFFLKKKHLL